MQLKFKKMIDNQIVLEKNYLDSILTNATEMIMSKTNYSQYFVYVDRNSDKQLGFVCFFDSINKNANLLGI